MSAAAKPAQILIVEDHPMVREGLRCFIERQPDMRVCGEASGEEEALQLALQFEPDLVIVDMSLATGHGMALIKQLKQRQPAAKVLVHSMYDESVYAERALRAGAMGYVNKQEDPDAVIGAVRQVLNGKLYVSPAMAERVLSQSVGRAAPAYADPVSKLSDREFEVFRLIGEGLTTGKIARRLNRSVHTIDTHRENIKAKLHLKDGAELSRCAVQWVLENG